jgi:hypothetical protein
MAGTDGRVLLQDANNYAATTSTAIPVVQTAAGADLRICWNGLAKDLLCHDLGPSNPIDNVAFLQIPNMTRAQVTAALAVGQLDPAWIRVYADYHVAQSPGSCAMLSQFKLGQALVPAVDYVEDPNKTYLLLLTTGVTPVVGARSMLFLDPTRASSVTAVDAVDACATGVLHFQATLGQPISISQTDNTKWRVDWSQVTHDSFNNAVNSSKLDFVQLGFYQNLTAADLQERFVDFELLATSLYEVPVALGARDVDLAGARLRGTSEPFLGFTRTNGVWALAIRCSKCQTFNPVVFSILQPQ